MAVLPVHRRPALSTLQVLFLVPEDEAGGSTAEACSKGELGEIFSYSFFLGRDAGRLSPSKPGPAPSQWPAK